MNALPTGDVVTVVPGLKFAVMAIGAVTVNWTGLFMLFTDPVQPPNL
jgi:hypothetical protein